MEADGRRSRARAGDAQRRLRVLERGGREARCGRSSEVVAQGRRIGERGRPVGFGHGAPAGHGHET